MSNRSVRQTAAWSRFGAVYGVGIFALYAAVILSRGQPPSLGDLGDLTYQGMILRTHMLGGADQMHWVKRYPVPNGAVTVGIGLLALVLPWTMAAKAWLCVQFSLSIAAVLSVMRARERLGRLDHGAVWCLVPTVMFFNLNFWYGFLNFELGLCWALFFVAMLLGEIRRQWLIGAGLLLGFFSHMVAFGFMVLLLLTFLVQTRRWRLGWQLVPSLIASIWYLIGRFALHGNADGEVGMVNEMRQFSPEFWAFKVNSYLKSFGWVNLGTRAGSATLHVLGSPAYLLLFVVNAILCGLLGWCMIRTSREAFRVGSRERFVWVTSAIYFVCGLLAPSFTLGISDPGSRLLEISLAVGLLLCTDSGLLRAAAVCSLPLAAVSLVLMLRAAYVVLPVEASGRGVPQVVVHFAHVPNHNHDEYYAALREGNMRLGVFPTGLLLNAPGVKLPPSREH